MCVCTYVIGVCNTAGINIHFFTYLSYKNIRMYSYVLFMQSQGRLTETI